MGVTTATRERAEDNKNHVTATTYLFIVGTVEKLESAGVAENYIFHLSKCQTRLHACLQDVRSLFERTTDGLIDCPIDRSQKEIQDKRDIAQTKYAHAHARHKLARKLTQRQTETRRAHSLRGADEACCFAECFAETPTSELVENRHSTRWLAKPTPHTLAVVFAFSSWNGVQ